MAIKSPDGVEKQRLESKKYRFIAEGSMPVLEFEMLAQNRSTDIDDVEKLTIELYNPMSREVFEAKFSKGRIEVDRDGSVTYFNMNSDRVNLSLFADETFQFQ